MIQRMARSIVYRIMCQAFPYHVNTMKVAQFSVQWNPISGQLKHILSQPMRIMILEDHQGFTKIVVLTTVYSSLSFQGNSKLAAECSTVTRTAGIHTQLTAVAYAGKALYWRVLPGLEVKDIV